MQNSKLPAIFTMDQIIDDTFNRKEREVQDIYFRKSFPKGLARLGYILLGVGILFVIGGSFIGGAILAGIGGFFSLSFSGIKIDFANKEAKHYTALYGYKMGSWVSLKSYPFIGILRSKSGIRANSFVSQMSYSEITFDVYLLSKSHRDRFLLRSVADELSAKISAKELGLKLGVEYANYNPQAKSRLKRG
jgi:hypothetical protein